MVGAALNPVGGGIAALHSSSQVLTRRIVFHPAARADAHSLISTGLIPLNDPFEIKQSADVKNKDVFGKKNAPAKASSSPAAGRAQEGTPGSSKNAEERDKEDEIGDLQLTWKGPRKIGAGLSNLGNTCFLNSVLQCLTYTPPLALFLESGRHKATCKVAGFCAMCTLQAHVMRALAASGGTVSPTALVRNIRSIARSFRIGRQEDAHEYMRYLVEALYKCCLPPGKPKRSHPGEGGNQEEPTSIVHRIFGGKLRSQVMCTVCSYGSNTYDPFLDLSLDIVRADSIERALQRFTAEDVLDGDNRYKCSRCKKKVRALKRFTIDRSPPVLTVQLKRFTGVSGKIDKHVKFSPTLDLRRFVSVDQQGRGGLQYELYGVLVHAGGSTHSGHYYCFVRTSAAIWHVLDDSRVRQVSERTVLDQKAYILFYIRKSPPPPAPAPAPAKEAAAAAAARAAPAPANGSAAANQKPLSSQVSSAPQPGAPTPNGVLAHQPGGAAASVTAAAATAAAAAVPAKEVLPDGTARVSALKATANGVLPADTPLAKDAGRFLARAALAESAEGGPKVNGRAGEKEAKKEEATALHRTTAGADEVGVSVPRGAPPAAVGGAAAAPVVVPATSVVEKGHTVVGKKQAQDALEAALRSSQEEEVEADGAGGGGQGRSMVAEDDSSSGGDSDNDDDDTDRGDGSEGAEGETEKAEEEEGAEASPSGRSSEQLLGSKLAKKAKATEQQQQQQQPQREPEEPAGEEEGSAADWDAYYLRLAELAPPGRGARRSYMRFVGLIPSMRRYFLTMARAQPRAVRAMMQIRRWVSVPAGRPPLLALAGPARAGGASLAKRRALAGLKARAGMGAGVGVGVGAEGKDEEVALTQQGKRKLRAVHEEEGEEQEVVAGALAAAARSVEGGHKETKKQKRMTAQGSEDGEKGGGRPGGNLTAGRELVRALGAAAAAIGGKVCVEDNLPLPVSGEGGEKRVFFDGSVNHVGDVAGTRGAFDDDEADPTSELKVYGPRLTNGVAGNAGHSESSSSSDESEDIEATGGSASGDSDSDGTGGRGTPRRTAGSGRLNAGVKGAKLPEKDAGVTTPQAGLPNDKPVGPSKVAASPAAAVGGASNAPPSVEPGQVLRGAAATLALKGALGAVGGSLYGLPVPKWDDVDAVDAEHPKVVDTSAGQKRKARYTSWDAELDKGRQKKVRQRVPLSEGEPNPFQTKPDDVDGVKREKTKPKRGAGKERRESSRGGGGGRGRGRGRGGPRGGARSGKSRF